MPSTELHAELGRLRAALHEQERIVAIERTARNRAEAAVHARHVLMRTAAHELRTPIGTIKISADTMMLALQRGPLTAEVARRFLDMIGRSSDRLASMVTELLDTSSIETELLHIELERMDLAVLARTVARGYQERTSGAAITCQIRSPPTWILGDPGRLQQVLDTMLGNALKYSPEGGEIVIRLQSGASGALLSVQDVGIGLPLGHAERIFQPFQRAPNAIEFGAPGLGLGLHISRQIAEGHGGTLSAKSPGEGRGTVLTLRLTAAPEPGGGPRTGGGQAARRAGPA